MMEHSLSLMLMTRLYLALVMEKMMLYTLVRIRFPFLTRKITAYIMTEFSVHTAKSVFLMNITIIIILENILALIADLKEIIHSSLLLPQTLIRAR